MKIYCCQHDIEWENKPANFARVRKLIAKAKPEHGSLVLLPEMFATGFTMNVASAAEGAAGETAGFLSATARELGVHLLAGVIGRAPDGRGRNQAVVFSPDGRGLAHYTKLQPFVPGGEAEHYAAGDRIVTFQWQGVTVAPFICYDLRFPEVFRHAAQASRPQLMTVIASWPEARIEHFVKLVQARAIENQCYVAGVNRIGSDPQFNYTGRTLIADFMGKVVADAGKRECVIKAKLDLAKLAEYRAALPFLNDMRTDFVRRL